MKFNERAKRSCDAAIATGTATIDIEDLGGVTYSKTSWVPTEDISIQSIFDLELGAFDNDGRFVTSVLVSVPADEKKRARWIARLRPVFKRQQHVLDRIATVPFVPFWTDQHGDVHDFDPADFSCNTLKAGEPAFFFEEKWGPDTTRETTSRDRLEAVPCRVPSGRPAHRGSSESVHGSVILGPSEIMSWYSDLLDREKK